MPSLEGQILKGRYRIDELIGRGGMAEVYRAWDTWRNHHVAVKVMREDLAEDPKFVRRFQREAGALAALAHESIVRFYSFEREGLLAFIVMGYVEGITLRAEIAQAQGPLPMEQVCSVAEQVCAALHYAHMEGVLHRDVKPGNIMIRQESPLGTHGSVLVTDFGIAKAVDAAMVTTVIPGTPAYMSPEQCRNEPLDVRTDVYSLGIVVYEMLTGRRPFVGDTAPTTSSTRERVRWEQMHAEPPSPRQFNQAVSLGVEEAVRTALAKERKARWPTVLAFWQALREALGMPEPEEGIERVRVQREPDSVDTEELAPLTPPPTERPAAPKTAPGPVAQRTGLTQLAPWVWALGGVLLVGVIILVMSLASRGAGPAMPTGEVMARATSALPTLRPTFTPLPIATLTPTPTPEQPTLTPTPPDATATGGAPTEGATAYPSPTSQPPTPTPTSEPPTPTHTPTPIPPTATPRPRWLAFETNRGSLGDYEIFAMTSTGARLANLTNSWADDVAPVWSPDGQRIAFVSYRDTLAGKWDLGPGSIYLMDFDPLTGVGGGNQTRLTGKKTNDGWPTWSPDGQRIAFESERSGNWDIWVVNLDGSGLANLTNHPGDDRYPAWSPDGAQIAFTSKRSGNYDVWLMNADGSNPVNLTKTPGRDRYTMWSPDGARMAFNTKRDGNQEIYVMNRDGSNQTNVTHSPHIEGLADWSPGGGRLVVYSDRSGDKEIYILNLSTGQWTNVSNSPDSEDEFCTWSP